MGKQSQIYDLLWLGKYRSKELAERLNIPERTIRWNLAKMIERGSVIREKRFYTLSPQFRLSAEDQIEIPPFPQVTPKNMFWVGIAYASVILGAISYVIGYSV